MEGNLEHRRLLQHLGNIRKKKQKLYAASQQFFSDPSVQEKSIIQKSVRELLMLSPEVVVLCAQTAAIVERIANANEVAEKMTKEVRRLDIIQSRLLESASQSEQLLTLRNCLNGAKNALRDRNYQEAARYFSTLKEIEKGLPLDPVDKFFLTEMESDLREVLTKSFETALRDNDKQKMQTFAPLFQAVGGAYEEKSFMHLLVFVKDTLHKKLLQLTVGTFSTMELIEHVTMVFNEVAAATQEYDSMAANGFSAVDGPARMIEALYRLGESAAVDILSCYMRQRKLSELMNDLSCEAISNRKTPASPTSSHLKPLGASSTAEDEIGKLNDQLNEIALMIQHTQSYERFMRSRISAVLSNGNAKNCTLHKEVPWNNTSELEKTVQELAGYYCFFENILLSKAAQKAFQWEELRFSNSGLTSEYESFPISSAVDEIFYVARNSGLRSLATGHVDCAGGAINMISTILRDILGDTMRSRIRGMSVYVKQNGEANILGSTTQLQQQMQQHLAKLSKNIGNVQMTAGGSALEKKKGLSPEVVMNSLEATVEYVAQLKEQLEREIPEDFPDVPAQLETCLGGLEDCAAEVKRLLDACRKQLGRMMEPKIASYLGTLVSSNSKKRVQYELTEEMFTFYEANDPFAHQFVAHMRDIFSSFRRTLSPTNFTCMVELAVIATADVLEKWFFEKETRFNQLGALQFDKDLRVITSFFSELCDCRTYFASLTQISVVLNSDSPSDVLEFYGRKNRGIEWKLPAARVKEVLARRVDFSDASINRLQLP